MTCLIILPAQGTSERPLFNYSPVQGFRTSANFKFHKPIEKLHFFQLLAKDQK